MTDWFVDEAAEIDEQCLIIINTRIGRQKNEEYWLIPKLLQTFNPDKGHVYRNFYKPSKDGSILPYRVFITALATDNKKLPASYIEQLRKADPITQQRLLHGNFEYDNTPGRLFNYDNLLAMWENPKLWGAWFISIDVARKGKDKTVLWIWEWFDLVDVIIEKTSDMRELAERITQIAKERDIWARYIIADEDGVWWGLVDNLRCQGFVNNSKPRQRKRPNLSTIRNFDNLKTQCYFELAKHIGKISIQVNSVTLEDGSTLYFKRDLLEELDVVVQTNLDSDTKLSIIKKEDIKAKIARSPDYSDMLMMRMYYELDRPDSIEDDKKEEEELTVFDLMMDDDEEKEIDEQLLDSPY